MTAIEHRPAGGGRRLTPADVRGVRFPHASMLRPGYSDAEVDRFAQRVAEELARLHAEKAELRDHLQSLRGQIDEVKAMPTPSDQAVRLLSTAQQTADAYVAEAEDFSRQMATDARSQYEDHLRRARESAGAIIQTAQEAAAKVIGERGAAPVEGGGRPDEEVQEQVAYLRAFAQATRTQLKAYLEALLADVEQEWGRADPGSVPQAPLRTSAQRATRQEERAQVPANVARDVPLDDSTSEHPVVTAEGGATAIGQS